MVSPLKYEGGGRLFRSLFRPGELILFEKLTPETGGWIWKSPFPLRLWGWKFHAKPLFFFNIFNGNLHFEALI